MKFGTMVAQALTAILRHKGRSFLTTLGIVIGIGAVIALLAIGTGVQKQIDDQIAKLGTTTLTIRSQMPRKAAGFRPGSQGPFGGGGPPGLRFGVATLSLADYDAVRALPGIAAASPQMIDFADIGPGTPGSDTVASAVTSVDASYFNIQQLTIDQGRALTAQDIAASAPVAVLGSGAAEELSPPPAPPVPKGVSEGASSIASPSSPSRPGSGLGGGLLNRTITIDGQPYRVVGVLQRKDTAFFTVGVNESVYIPYTAALKLFSRHKFASISALAVSPGAVAGVSDRIKATLLARHHIADPDRADFAILSAQQMLKTTETITGMVTSMLAGIASISLLVGGIGIMNVMLVTVTERTREIGLRRAVGAKAQHIVAQFLTESVILTIIGGVFGILNGYALSHLAAVFTRVHPVVTLPAILLALGVSSGIGILFGLFPALRAANLDPVEALRYE